MRKRILLAGILTAAMMAITACNDMPGMGNAQPAATQVKEGDSSEVATGDDKVYELKISTSQIEQALVTRNYQKLADVLNEKPDGRLEMSVFPPGQFDSDEDVLKQAIQGANVAVSTDTSRVGQYVKDLSVLMMGYFADNCEEYYKIAQTGTFKGRTDSLSKDRGIKILSFIFYGGPRHFMTNRPINTPEDLKGMRIRTIEQRVCIETTQAMGATPTSMLWGEAYSGVQSKALEGCEARNTSTYPSKLYEVRKYQSETRHFQLMQGLICGQNWFESLPEDLQTLLVEASIEIDQKTAADVITEVDEAEKTMVGAGMTTIEPDLAPFKAVVNPVYEKLGCAELRDKLCKEIDKTN